MAKIVISDYVDIGTGGFHDATSWEFYYLKYNPDDITEEPEKVIIDSVERDVNNVKFWNSPLPKKDKCRTCNGTGGSGKCPTCKGSGLEVVGYYTDLKELRARVKIFVGGYESEWYELGPVDQTEQDILITQDGEVIEETTTTAIGLQP